MASRYQTLNEETMKQFQDDLDWRYITWNQRLSEKFVIEMKDKIYFADFGYRQPHLSKSFLKEFDNYIFRDTLKYST